MCTKNKADKKIEGILCTKNKADKISKDISCTKNKADKIEDILCTKNKADKKASTFRAKKWWLTWGFSDGMMDNILLVYR